VSLDDAVFETVVVSDEWVVEGFQCGLEFQGDADETLSGVDQVPDLAGFGTTAPELGL
jgi:hypothetical protein